MILDYLVENASRIGQLALSHLWLTLLPTALGLLVSLPLGWLAHSRRRIYPLVVGVSGLLYTIPSLALFVVLPGLLGTLILDPLNVVIALTVYSVALLVRVVADGLGAVPVETVQAAEAMGYRSWQRLLRVQLPVAVPVIMGGLRVAVVSNVSIVTMAAIIGIPQLGSLFTEGYSLRRTEPIVVGIVACLVLAVLLDLAILRLSRSLTPWRQRVTR